MTGILSGINGIIFFVTSLFLFFLSLSSFHEKEFRAGVLAGGGFLLNSLFWGWCLLAPAGFQDLNLILLAGFGLFVLVSSIRFFPGPPPVRDTSRALPYDERDTMFARNNLQHYPELMEKYYTLRPENRSKDRQIHQKPEFGEKEQVFHDADTAPCYAAAFEYLERSIPLSAGEVFGPEKAIDPIRFARTITEFAEFYGAVDVGFLPLLPHHFYSHKGRHAQHWGDRTDTAHKTAIAIVVPMRVDMIKKGPTSCVLQESARKYVEAAKISNILAGYIRQFGYPARAHNDANYEILCVPIAVETGLGELGRMGLFMHRTHGPCVRLAVVTTTLELPRSKPNPPLHMEDFCRMCKKCADNCPSGSISQGDEPVSRNIRHWSIHQEKCFSYWKTMGSDCGVCLSVCPYTKPNTLIHRIVRLYISRNRLNQKIALFMDDLLYGRHKKIAGKNPENIFNPDQTRP